MKKPRPLFYLNLYGRLKDSNHSIDKLKKEVEKAKNLPKATSQKIVEESDEKLDKLDIAARKDAMYFGKSAIIWAILSESILTLTTWFSTRHHQGNGAKIGYYTVVAQLFPVLLIALYLGTRPKVSSRNFHHLAFSVNLFGVIAIAQGEFFSLVALGTGKSTFFLTNITVTYLIFVFVLLLFTIYEESGKAPS